MLRTPVAAAISMLSLVGPYMKAEAQTPCGPYLKNPPCAQWKCTSGGWELYDLPAGASCSDGNVCTQNDTCNAYGTCIGRGTPGATCNDADRLTYDDTCVLNDTSSAPVCKGRPLPFEVRFFDSATKMSQYQAFTTDRTAVWSAVTAARNEFEAFQIAIRPTSLSSPLTVTIAPLRSTATNVTIPVDVYREKFFDTTSVQSSYDATPGSWPDWLEPGTTQADGITRATTLYPFAGANEIAYVETFAPEQAPAGTYSAEVSLTWTESGAEKSASFPVQLTVHPFAIPQTSSLRSYYRMFPDNACSPYGTSDISSPECTSILLQIAQMGLEHRISVDPTRAKSAPIKSDFVQTFADFVDGRRPGNARLTAARPRTPGAYPDDADPAYLGAWYGVYNVTNDWLSRSFYYVCDEPQNATTPCPKNAQNNAWPEVKRRAELAQSISAGIYRLVTTNPEAAQQGLAPLGASYVSLIDFMTPNVVSVQPAAGQTGPAFPPDLEQKYAEYRTATAGRRQMWWYQACDAGGCVGSLDSATSGYPQLAIDVPAAMNRSMPWMTYRFGIASELYWDVTHAFSTGGINTAAMVNGQTWGDGTLFYPGPTGPHPSLRLKLIRDGMEDYEYLKLIADQNCAMAIANDLYPHALAAASKPATALLSHRKAAADKILNPSSACPYCPPNLSFCGPACVNLNTDPWNCGTCGHVCSSGLCTNQKCGDVTCSTGYTNCSGTCVNLASDPSNCGTCGAFCPGTCTSSVCRERPDPICTPLPGRPCK